MNDNGSMFAAPRSAVIARRAAAGLAATSAVLHGLMLGDVGTVAAAVLMAGMAGACLYCARELWLAGTTRAWCLVAVMNLAMVAVHLPVSAGHHGRHVAVDAAVPPSTIMTVATALAITEVVIAATVLWCRTRGNARALSAAPKSAPWS